jgi:hypothetical protein
MMEFLILDVKIMEQMKKTVEQEKLNKHIPPPRTTQTQPTTGFLRRLPR